ncbi:MAG TPA: hypothetical protein PK924_07385, partial [Bacilli bacterium]|nr:hypothetical protein [Bacilli bacterium]
IVKLMIENNTLKLKNAELEEIIKKELYNKFMNDLNMTSEVKRLREENYKIRKKVKRLKQEKK